MEALRELLLHLNGQGSAAGDAVFERSQLLGRDLRIVEQSDQHRRHPGEERHAIAGDSGSGVLRAEPQLVRDSPPGVEQGVLDIRLAERVIKRQRRQPHVAGLEDDDPVRPAAEVPLRHELRVVVEAKVSQLRAFRLARGAARVKDHGRVAARRLRQVARRGRLNHVFHSLRVGWQRSHIEADRVDLPAAGDALGRLDRDGRRVRVHHERAGLAVLELKGDFVRDEQRIQRHDDAAGVERPEIGDRESGNVRHHQRDAVAGLHADRPQFAGEPSRRFVQFGERHLPAIVDRGGQLRRGRGRISQD